MILVPARRTWSPGKSAADLFPEGGKPNRPRDDDDDYDDDEDDDRPVRRGKKKKAASGGVGDAADPGRAWRCSSSPGPAAVRVLRVLQEGHPGRVQLDGRDHPRRRLDAARRGGASVRSPPAGWKTHQGDGFSVSLPDMAVQKKTLPDPLTGSSMSMIAAERPGQGRRSSS